MQTLSTRRTVLAGAACLFPVTSVFADDAKSSIAAIERRTGGRLGVAALDTGSGRRIGHRADERFPMCSTFKLLAVATILRRADRREEQLDRLVRYGPDDILEYAPITKQHIQTGMTVGDLCAAAIEYSDNTAANLLLGSIGGPAAVTRYARSLGDPVTRLDRNEPTLNTAIPGDDRDTTSPAAMLADLRTLLLDDALAPASRGLLTDWLVANTTGGAKIRAGVPSGWRVGDKTGNGGHGSSNDVAILWPPGRRPILVAVYCTGPTASADSVNAAIADVGKIIAAQLG